MIRRSVVHNGVWKKVKTIEYTGCCDCGLVHKVEYRTRNNKLECRVWRDEDLSKEARRRFKHPLWPRSTNPRRGTYRLD